MADIIRRISDKLRKDLPHLKNVEIERDRLDRVIETTSNRIRVILLEALEETDTQQFAIGKLRELSEIERDLINSIINTGTVAANLSIFLSNDYKTARKVLKSMDEDIRQQIIEELGLCDSS